MAYKVTKKEVSAMSKAELLFNFERCMVALTHESNEMRGLTKTTRQSYDLLKNSLLDVMESDSTYDDDGTIIDR